MFSPATKRSNFSAGKDRSLLGHPPPPESPITPLAENGLSLHDNTVPNRPSTGTPAPWISRLSVLARIPPAKKGDKPNDLDPVQPVFVADFPQVLRNEQGNLLQNRVRGDFPISGGMEKETSLAWIICGNRLFVWNYLSPAASRKCVVLDLPSDILEDGESGRNSCPGDRWMLFIVNWDITYRNTYKVVQPCNSAGIVLCNRRTRALVYWPNIYSEDECSPIVSLATDELEMTYSHADRKITPNRQQQHIRSVSSSAGSSCLNSLIASAIPGGRHICVALACGSNGELWQFYCSPTGIQREKINQDILSSSYHCSDGSQHLGSKGYPRSLIWRFSHCYSGETNRHFFLLTDHVIQCFTITLSTNITVLKLWSHEIVGADGDSGIQENLAGQKQIWPLDMQVDNQGKVITVLIATFCKDRLSSSSYIEYSLLTMQYRPGINMSPENNVPINEKILEKKAPIQVIIPKARVEEEDFLFSMRLRVGGKPPGSATILSGDETATVTHYWRNSTRLYQFDLPYDAGKVLDASVFPSSDDDEDGAWAVLTEKAGVWVIPEKAVLLGGVEPPERSLSRKGSSNEKSAQEERRNLSAAGNIAPRRASSEAWHAGDGHRAIITGIASRKAQDEESEALLSHLFHDFLLSEQVDGLLDKLRSAGAFEKEGETNVFARVSKSIVDTLAKHWTTTRGAEIVALTFFSSQLTDKQKKHQKFLQFLALSKCHEELSSSQGKSLQTIVEHGEKLAAMIKLRELQNLISQNYSTGVGRPHPGSESGISGSLWDLIQLVGERARRNTVLLMDRDNAEVFYSKVSDLEELFNCLDKRLEYIINTEMPLVVQIQRACELSTACVTIIRAAIQYRNEHNMWYPSPEGLTPWCCQPVVRSGLWSIASLMLQLLNEISHLDMSRKSDFHSNLEALAEILLEAYSGAITANVERGKEQKSLLAEYWNRRDALLDSLYQHVKSSVETRDQDLGEGNEEQSELILSELSSHLFSIAKRHEGYQTMWNICCDLNDLEVLRNLMHESMGPKGGFSNFVFKQLYDTKQLSKLIRLGEEFQSELANFLKQHEDLLWLHQVFLHQFFSASETLHTLALSQDDDSVVAAVEGTESHGVEMEPTLAERKRLLHLSKIAAVAGRNADSGEKLKRIEADLKILKLQEEILKLLPDEEKQSVGNRLLRPLDLIELCLKSPNRELSLWAFDLFAWTSSSFLKSNRSLLDECWRNLANQDDWGIIYQMSVTQGWSDEDTIQHLRETMLFQGSSRCYGPEADTIEGGFDEVLPLRQENSDIPILKDMGSSVEGILMQHKDFPEAGKLMVMAIMLGVARVGTEM